jgi:PLP dependent protein
MTDQDIRDSISALRQIEADIAQAALRAKRKASATLIAVSKTQSAEIIYPVLKVGHAHFGENRVQEAHAKWPALKREFPDTKLHLIGALQSNKAEEAVALFDFIHTLDRKSLADALAQAMVKLNRRSCLFIQVNTGAEAQKSGCATEALPDLLAYCQSLALPVVGLMCLPPLAENPAPHFALLAELVKRHQLPELSMGMSDDFAVGVQLGATFVRVGSKIFGARHIN